MEFESFPKMQRTEKMSTRFIITEKLDGSNAQICFDEEGKMWVGSRNRWITPGKNTDNYGFAQWCLENEEELRKLGRGRHFGEWYGEGIGPRGNAYGEAIRAANPGIMFPSREVAPIRRLALFNTTRFAPGRDTLPACCEVVKVLLEGNSDVRSAMRVVEDTMRTLGSQHVPGMMDPEGYVVYLPGQRAGFKRVFDKRGPSAIEHPDA